MQYDLLKMSPLSILLLLLVGLCAGYIGGLAGVGGGIILVPALVFILGFSQHLAQGTSLAIMLPPIGILAAWQYYNQGEMDIKVALVVIAGYLVGNYLGGKLAVNVSDETLRKIFAVFILIVSIKMLFFTNGNGH
ncbi:MAG TPA: sulfite exporter TauE/SafE family protein [Balneolales bacterium]|nr:sulfite exporter TauE/SafE family protein [Balneolales bacterium]